MPNCQCLRHRATQGESDNVGRIRPQSPQESSDVVGHLGNGVGAGRFVAPAVAAQVRHQDPVPLAQGRRLQQGPVLRAGAQTVDQHHRRPVPLGQIVQPQTVHLDVGHARLRSIKRAGHFPSAWPFHDSRAGTSRRKPRFPTRRTASFSGSMTVSILVTFTPSSATLPC